MNAPMTYVSTGVDYGAMDPFKRLCQQAAYPTTAWLERFGWRELETSRGESAYLIETGWEFPAYIAHVEEGLGTKNLVADAMYLLSERQGRTYYDAIAQDTIAMIVNDMVTLGALPMSIAMHLAVGDGGWFDDERRSADLVRGWQEACLKARVTWGGGETPTLKGCVVPGAVVLSGSAVGIVRRRQDLLSGDKIEDGDHIVLIESSGIHANGLTLARKIAEKLPDGYLTRLPDGRAYGETLLDPTYLYSALVEECLHSNIPLHYVVHITGHGWRKLMRAKQNFRYVITNPPLVPDIFRFIQEHGPVTDEEAYGNLNMGAGFALYVPEAYVEQVCEIALTQQLRPYDGGYIEAATERSVHIEPVGITFKADSLAVR